MPQRRDTSEKGYLREKLFFSYFKSPPIITRREEKLANQVHGNESLHVIEGEGGESPLSVRGRLTGTRDHRSSSGLGKVDR